MQRTLDQQALLNDFFAGFEYLSALEGTNGKVGATGFCYGGGVVNRLAAAYPEMAAGVPFYGSFVDAEQVAGIQAPLMIQLGALDQRINAMWPPFQQALEENDKRYEAHIYPDVNHGFHNARFDRLVAKAHGLHDAVHAVHDPSVSAKQDRVGKVGACDLCRMIHDPAACGRLTTVAKPIGFVDFFDIRQWYFQDGQVFG